MENANPIIKNNLEKRFDLQLVSGKLANVTKESIFELIRDIMDPEHPHTLEQLNVVSLEDIYISQLEDESVMCQAGQPINCVNIIFTPTVPHCSMAGIIGLTIIYKLQKIVDGYLINVLIKADTHSTYKALNKQFSDRDRVMAAFENEGLVEMMKFCTNE